MEGFLLTFEKICSNVVEVDEAKKFPKSIPFGNFSREYMCLEAINPAAITTNGKLLPLSHCCGISCYFHKPSRSGL